jgi:hypothetical protein
MSLALGGGDVSPRNRGFPMTKKLHYMHDRSIKLLRLIPLIEATPYVSSMRIGIILSVALSLTI